MAISAVSYTLSVAVSQFPTLPIVIVLVLARIALLVLSAVPQLTLDATQPSHEQGLQLSVSVCASSVLAVRVLVLSAGSLSSPERF
jgi:hypothetical protein